MHRSNSKSFSVAYKDSQSADLVSFWVAVGWLEGDLFTHPSPLLSSSGHCCLNHITTCCLVSFNKIWRYSSAFLSMHHFFALHFLLITDGWSYGQQRPNTYLKHGRPLNSWLQHEGDLPKCHCRYIYNNIFKMVWYFLMMRTHACKYNFKPSSGASNSLRAGLVIFRFYFLFVPVWQTISSRKNWRIEHLNEVDEWTK